jgi:hypothetical protein
MPWEMGLVHGASKCLRACPFKTEDVSFMIITTPMARVPHALLGLCTISIPKVPIERMDGLGGHGLKIPLARKSFTRPEPLGWPFAPHPCDVWVAKQRHRFDVARNSPPIV